LKRLTISYNGAVLFDADVAEFLWSDVSNGVKVEGKLHKASGGGAEGLMGILSGVSKAASKKMAEDKRAEYVESLSD
jgi:hypothetical protein